jgi:hypothetical protein
LPLNTKGGQGTTDAPPVPSSDMASLSAMLNAKWKSGPASGTSKAEPVRALQVRSFRIAKLDTSNKKNRT